MTIAQERHMDPVRLCRAVQELVSPGLPQVPQQGGTDSQYLIQRCPDGDRGVVHLLISSLVSGFGMGVRT